MTGSIIHHAIEHYPLIALLCAALFLILEGGEAPFFFMLYIAHEIRLPLVIAVFLCAVLMFAGDIIYYLLGPKLERWQWFRWFERHTRRPIQMAVRYPFFVLPIMRFAYGFWHPVMVQLRSGGLPLWTLIEASILATSIWALALTSFYLLVLPTGLHYLRHIELVMSGIIIGAILISMAFRIFLHRHLKGLNVDTSNENI